MQARRPQARPARAKSAKPARGYRSVGGADNVDWVQINDGPPPATPANQAFAASPNRQGQSMRQGQSKPVPLKADKF